MHFQGQIVQCQRRQKTVHKTGHLTVRDISIISYATVLLLSWNYARNYITPFPTTFMFWAKANSASIMAEWNRSEQGNLKAQTWNSVNSKCKLHISSLNHYYNFLYKIIYTIYHLNNKKYKWTIRNPNSQFHHHNHQNHLNRYYNAWIQVAT